jgi:hypothetical protein
VGAYEEFSGTDRRSDAYGRFLADGLTRSLVAARAREMSGRTGGYILLQLLFDLSRHGANADRVPAHRRTPGSRRGVAQLERSGVTLRLAAPVVGIDCSGHRITGVTIGGEESASDGSTADLHRGALRGDLARAARRSLPLRDVDREDSLYDGTAVNHHRATSPAPPASRHARVGSAP